VIYFDFDFDSTSNSFIVLGDSFFFPVFSLVCVIISRLQTKTDLFYERKKYGFKKR
jgi:hypothetical protein